MENDWDLVIKSLNDEKLIYKKENLIKESTPLKIEFDKQNNCIILAYTNRDY